MMSPSDQELVKSLARGDTKAFDAIYDRCRLPVFRFALHMSGSHEIADEVTQDAFLFLLRQPGTYSQEKGALSSFLVGVARNLVRRSYRNASSDISIEDDEIEKLIAGDDSTASPLDVVIRQQSAETLQAAILGLPQSYREVIVLYDLQEMSYAETAAMLEIPIGTVRSRLHRGHVALLDLMSRGRLVQKGVSR